MINVAVIAPQLAPSINGVGDHARLLAEQLHRDHDVATHFVVGDPTWEGPDVVAGFPVTRVDTRSAQALVTALESTQTETLLLHYVGYGYAKRGCPVWLVDGIECWLQRDRQRRLLTFFHELYAFGPPWSSAFWLSSLQQYLFSRLARMSHSIITNNLRYAERLTKIGARSRDAILTLPVFSNVGELYQPPCLAERSKRLVTFGRSAHRSLVFQKYLSYLQRACQLLEIEEICDVGPPISMDCASLDGIPIVSKGAISAAEVSALLQDSVAGFLSSATPDYLAKSGVFAAFCAHGLLTILPSGTNETIDGITCGKHYWAANDNNQIFTLSQAQHMADAAHAWYHEHNLAAQAGALAVRIAVC